MTIKPIRPLLLLALLALTSGCRETETREAIANLRNPNLAAKRAAIIYLGKNQVDRPAAIEGLVSLLLIGKDPSRLTKEQILLKKEAVTALGRIRNKATRPKLESVLTDPDVTIRLRAAEALGKVGQKESTRPLADAIRKLREEDKQLTLEGRDTDTTTYALLTTIWALGEVSGQSDADAIQLLSELTIGDDRHIQYNAERALNKMRTRD